MKWLIALGLAVLGLIAFVVTASGDRDYQEKVKARAAIRLCWEEQARKSLDPGSQRFVASVCEKMEEKFFKDFGHKP